MGGRWVKQLFRLQCMIVCHRRRFIFFHNPKCAGTALREALAPWHDDPFEFRGVQPAPYFLNQLDHAHLRLWEMQVLFPHIVEAARSYRSVVIVRNPYRRFISAVDEHFKMFQPRVPLQAMSPAERVETIETLIERGLTVARITTNYRFIHFSPQLWFVRIGEQQIPTNVVAMDDHGQFVAEVVNCLGVPVKEVQHANRSRSDLTHVLTSPKIAAFVRQFYAMDFWYLASDPALRHLTRPIT